MLNGPSVLSLFVLGQSSPRKVSFLLYKCVAFGRANTLKKHISAIHLKIKRSRGAK